MSNQLSRLLEAAKRFMMDDEQREEQRRSFAFGNASIENERVTRETVDKAADELSSERSGERG